MEQCDNSGKNVFEYVLYCPNITEELCDLFFKERRINIFKHPTFKTKLNFYHPLLLLSNDIFKYILKYVEVDGYFINWIDHCCNINNKKLLYTFEYLSNKFNDEYYKHEMKPKLYNIMATKLKQYKNCITLLLSIKNNNNNDPIITNLMYIIKNNKQKIINDIYF